MVRVCWAGGGAAHASLVTQTVSQQHSLAPDTADLALVVQGRSIPVHR